MKYEIIKLDGRFSYRHLFEYCIKFSNGMSINQGPQKFNQVHKWFVETHGWSAEIRQWAAIQKWHHRPSPMMSFNGGWVKSKPTNLPEECNPNWSWTNGYDDLRIYVATEAELSFFQLKFPLDQ